MCRSKGAKLDRHMLQQGVMQAHIVHTRVRNVTVTGFILFELPTPFCLDLMRSA